MKKSISLSQENIDISAYGSWQGQGVALWWLGQAGFLICSGNLKILVDAYLSDALAEKYRGQMFPHIRMMAPPLSMESLDDIDFCISSHAHSDHLDPGLLPVLSRVSPACRFIVPEAALSTALERGVPGDRLIGMDAGSFLSLGDNAEIRAVPAAHEELLLDDGGRHFFLGYILELGDFRIYHPGDCIPYDGLDQWLENRNIDLALMPVNGRREDLSSRGIAGNFSLEEAYQIVLDHDITYLIPHHYGMFDFNTLSREKLDEFIQVRNTGQRVHPAETGVMYNLIRI